MLQVDPPLGLLLKSLARNRLKMGRNSLGDQSHTFVACIRLHMPKLQVQSSSAKEALTSWVGAEVLATLSLDGMPN